MNTYDEENPASETSRWSLILLSVVSTILGSGALWYSWFRYTSIVNRPDFQLYNWIQPAFIALMGILCLSATILFISGKSSGWSVFKAGLSIVPLILFSNLVILIFRVIQNILQGNAIPFISRLYVSPLNKAILAVALMLTLLSVLKGMKKS